MHPQLGDEPDFTSSEWLPPVMAVDEIGDVGPLIDMLLSSTPLTEAGRRLIADLLDRHRLRKKRGGQRTPIYQTPEAEALVRAAVQLLRRHELYKSNRDSALDNVSRQFGITATTLDNADLGKRGSSWRWRRRASRS